MSDDRLDALKQLRDEVAVRVHLGSKELQARFEELGRQFDQVMTRMGSAGGAAAQTADNVGAAVRMGMDELFEGYDRIRRAL